MGRVFMELSRSWRGVGQWALLVAGMTIPFSFSRKERSVKGVGEEKKWGEREREDSSNLKSFLERENERND